MGITLGKCSTPFNSVYNKYLFGICNGSFDYITEMLDFASSPDRLSLLNFATNLRDSLLDNCRVWFEPPIPNASATGSGKKYSSQQLITVINSL